VPLIREQREQLDGLVPRDNREFRAFKGFKEILVLLENRGKQVLEV
jgi:hypothetical protein